VPSAAAFRHCLDGLRAAAPNVASIRHSELSDSYGADRVTLTAGFRLLVSVPTTSERWSQSAR
jgi:hypothetical protein